MSKQNKSLRIVRSETDSTIQTQKQEIISNSVLSLSGIISETGADIEKIETYIDAIKTLINGKHTPYDEVNELKGILEQVEKRTERIKHRYANLSLFLEETKQQILLVDEDAKGANDE